MAEFPALPLFTDAYLGDTTHLTTHEHGAYLLLLIVSWRSAGCSIPDDDLLLARYTRMTRDKWRRTRPVLAEFFDIRDGRWHQARLQDEFQLLQSRRTQQVEAGNASARAKALKRRHRGSTTVGVSLQREVNETSTPTPTPTSDIETDVSTSQRTALPRCPKEVDPGVWHDFKRQRKKPLTATALAGIEREAAKMGWTLEQALRTACERGWQGFNADWIKDDRNGTGRSGNGAGRSGGNGRAEHGFTSALREAEEAGWGSDDLGRMS